MRFPEIPLWDFLIAVSECQSVASACLSFQERRGADVGGLPLNVLAFLDNGIGALYRAPPATWGLLGRPVTLRVVSSRG
jgi:hypothetical protein